jgi:pimeloyl-ACP methyl ester carboxylesterase
MGQQDRFAPVEMGRQLAGLLPNIPFEFIDAGQQVQMDAPDVVNGMVIDFFKAD